MDWLPALILLTDYDGDPRTYLNAVYRIFRRDFVVNQPFLEGRRCFCDSRDAGDGREVGFWHIVTEGKVEADRVPNIRRCERVAWPRAIIEAKGSVFVNAWEVDRVRAGKGKKDRRLLLAPTDFSYLVVLKRTSKAFILVSAYFLREEHERSKKRKEFEGQK